MKKITLALLSGGTSSEREVSLKSGQEVYQSLNKDKYTIKSYDPATDLKKIVDDAEHIDVALVMLHGPDGEDGKIQGFLDLLKIPYQCSGVAGSAMAMDKVISKTIYTQNNLPVAAWEIVKKNKPVDSQKIISHLGLPLFVKPVSGGSSIGMSKVDSAEALPAAVKEALKYDNTVLIETYISGTEITCGVIGNQKAEALPVIEIIPDSKNIFFDFTAKYTPGATQEICPARISKNLTQKASEFALKAHLALGLKGYSRTDMIIDKQDNIYLLETNTIPGMTKTSLFPQAAQKAGYSFATMLDRLVELALEK
jgi:D-alanine-D-alanine ligase